MNQLELFETKEESPEKCRNKEKHHTVTSIDNSDTNVEPELSLNIPTCMTSTWTIGDEANAILQLLHSTNGQQFRQDIEPWLTPEERRLIAAAESLELYWQAVHVFRDAIRRLTLRWARLTGWPNHSLAEIVQPAKLITPTLRCVVLNMPKSRNLQGHVAFKVSNPQMATARFPESALLALAEVKEYFLRIAYLEPLYDAGKLLRSQAAVRKKYARPKDPIIAAILGVGPLTYGYEYNRFMNNVPSQTRRQDESGQIVFLIAHWG